MERSLFKIDGIVKLEYDKISARAISHYVAVIDRYIRHDMNNYN